MKVQVNVEVSDPKQVALASQFLAKLAALKGVKATASKTPAGEAPTDEPPAKRPAKRRTSSKGKASTLKIEDVRAQVKIKAKIDKQAVKDKLAEFGVKSTSDLDPSHYVEFMDFLKTIEEVE